LRVNRPGLLVLLLFCLDLPIDFIDLASDLLVCFLDLHYFFVKIRPNFVILSEFNLLPSRIRHI